MTRYCKECGHRIEFQYGENTGYCPICDKKKTYKYTIAGHALDARISQLKEMHDLMCEANDENLYISWINVMPDGASNEDFKDIALNDKMYNECFDLFVKLITK